jgi:putative ABC transport system ATP-binding protein
MHCIAGLDRLTSGEAFIGDTLLADLKDKKLTELRRSEVGFIFQSFNLVPTLTAEENINLPLSLGGRSGDREWIDTVIDTVGLRDRLSHRPSELSGGQQQRVAIARAIVTEPVLLVADEPTANLDSTTTEELLVLMSRLNTELGMTIITATHDPMVMAHAGRQVHLLDGLIDRDG